ncbi:aminopeptidase P family protein [Pelagibacteraceae bacterium]|nr:aminopeptidase P family protein [Pelagibacteraceae bacterium]
MLRPNFFQLKNGSKAKLPFSDNEYENRLKGLREIISKNNLDAVILTSMQNIAYYSGFLYCSFGRPYACIVTSKSNIVVSANIDASQPWRRCYGENLIYTDWERDNYLKAIISVLKKVKRVGVENDHLTLERHKNLKDALGSPELVDVAPFVMLKRMIKSNEEIKLITSGAKIADIGGEALIKEIKVGASEMDIAMVGRDAMEKAIAKLHPNSELRDTWVWFQSGINTDGAHNPVTTRKLEHGDILSLNTFPMISGYYTALERTLFVGTVDDASLKAWEANVKVHKRGIELIKPGAKCSEITKELNELFTELGYLEYRTFGYGHSFGVLSHYYGREGKLELREDIETVLEPNMVVSMEPMILIPNGKRGAGGYREHDILVIKENDSENITKFPFGPENNIIK